jgi:hypothetical protein
LRGYVEDSVQEVPTLGPEETAKKRTITSANSLLQVWRGLIARADATVLKHKRREDPSKKDTWTLKFMDHSNRQGRGPVFEISRVSQIPALSPCFFLTFWTSSGFMEPGQRNLGFAPN